MERSTIIHQITQKQQKEVLLLKKSRGVPGVPFRKKTQKKRDKLNYRQQPPFGTSGSTIYVQPPSFGKKSSSVGDTFRKMPRRGSHPSLKDEDIGTDLPMIPGERSGSMGSIATASTVSSGISFVSSFSSSSFYTTGSNIYNSGTFAMNSKEDVFMDDASVVTAAMSIDTIGKSHDGTEKYDDFDIHSSTSIPSSHQQRPSVLPSFRRLLSTMSTGSLLIVENEEEKSSDEFTAYCGEVEKNIISPRSSFGSENDKEIRKPNRRMNFLLHRRR